LGQHFGAGLYQVEVDYLVAEEWAQQAEDIVFRRTKLGLRMQPEQIDVLADYLRTAQVKQATTQS
jgi:glycerol-3-phosphate dehydrogenase